MSEREEDQQWSPASIELTQEEAALVVAPRAPAIEALGVIRPGFRMEIVNRGQFSQLDLMCALLRQTGPAEVTVVTFSIGFKDAAKSAWMVKNGEITKFNLVIDRAFKSLDDPMKYFRRLEDWFGVENVVQCRTHAKIVIITNERWSICVRSSANFNKNSRLEQFSLDDSPQIAAFYSEIVESWCRVVKPGFSVHETVINQAFDRHALIDIENTPAPGTVRVPKWRPGDVSHTTTSSAPGSGARSPDTSTSTTTNSPQSCTGAGTTTTSTTTNSALPLNVPDMADLLERSITIAEAAYNDRNYSGSLAAIRLLIDLRAQLTAQQLLDDAGDDARAQHLAELERALHAAREKGSSTAVASLLRQRQQLLGLDKPPPPPDVEPADLVIPSDPAEHRQQLIHDARRNRKRAEAAGSHTAAALYFREERALLGDVPIGDGDDTRSDEEILSDTVRLLDELLSGLDEETAGQVRGLLLGAGA